MSKHKERYSRPEENGIPLYPEKSILSKLADTYKNHKREEKDVFGRRDATPNEIGKIIRGKNGLIEE